MPLEADREKVIASVRTPVALQKYQSETAVRLRAILGEFPARTPLNPKVAGRLERSGYTVEKLIFESRPRYYVTANVYVPRGRTGLFPGVICPHFVDHQAQRFFAFCTYCRTVRSQTEHCCLSARICSQIRCAVWRCLAQVKGGHSHK